MSKYFNYEIAGKKGSILLTEKQYEGIRILMEDLYNTHDAYEGIKLVESNQIPNDILVKALRKKFKEILDNSLKNNPQFTREQVKGALKYYTYQRFQQLSFLFDRFEGVHELTKEQIEDYVRRDSFEKELIEGIFKDKPNQDDTDKEQRIERYYGYLKNIVEEK